MKRINSNRFKGLMLALGIMLSVMNIHAAKVDTTLVHSNSMNLEVMTVTIQPDKALKGERCPVIYLLHGYSGNAKSWLTIKPNLPQIADQQGIIFVCPDGKNSWYWDSPTQKDSKYETFVSTELVNYVDNTYATIANRKHRAITGLSMGGHGAMWLSIRHKDVFGACGSTSGGLDIRPFPNNWDMKALLDERDANKERWNHYTVINQLDKLENGDLSIIFDCGFDDFFYEVNKAVHTMLRIRNIDHNFIVRPGSHNEEYWNNSIDYHILFFKKFFES